MATQAKPRKTTTRAAIAQPAAKPALKTVAKPASRAAAVKISKSVSKPANKPAVLKTRAKAAVKAAVPALKPALKTPVKSIKKAEAKSKKIKQVRDSFTMPETEYAVLGQVKKACLKSGFEIKKSDLLRIGVSLIKGLDTAKLKTLLGGLTPLKVGRPKK